MDNTTVKMHVFLETCYEIENTCAEMYHFFAEHFIDDMKMSRLWRKTAMEEENHARQVLLAKKMVESISWISLESWRNASEAREMVKQIASSVQKSPPTLQDALLLALKCEDKMEYFHIHNALLMKEKAGNSMFKAMMEEDLKHVELLKLVLDAEQEKTDDEFESNWRRLCPVR